MLVGERSDGLIVTGDDRNDDCFTFVLLSDVQEKDAHDALSK